MKPQYPRPSKIPANFVFIGRGGSFTPVKGDKYWNVGADSRVHNNDLGFAYVITSLYMSGRDFYVKKNGPTHKLNRPISKKVAKYKVARYKMVWAVMENGRIFAKAGIRESARKIVKALNQLEG
jgi:hypothetical protein